MDVLLAIGVFLLGLVGLFVFLFVLGFLAYVLLVPAVLGFAIARGLIAEYLPD